MLQFCEPGVVITKNQISLLMFKSRFSLYNIEWLDLVFSNRNKSYGAYELRKHYNSNMLKALFITATLFTALVSVTSLLVKHQHDPAAFTKLEQETLINLTDLKPPPPEVAHTKKLNKVQPPAQTATQKVVQSQTMKVTPDELVKVDPKPITAQNSTAGLQDVAGDNIAGLNTPAGNGTSTETDKPDNEVKNIAMLEKLPEFPGGMEAWSKFLSKNIHYPEQAASNNIFGRVFMSFIVEKDGKITHVELLRGIGFGCDEEATRVLKIAPSWKPGIQNGRAVRVKYTMPINFTIQE